jgi:type VI secretion system protein VasI
MRRARLVLVGLLLAACSLEPGATPISDTPLPATRSPLTPVVTTGAWHIAPVEPDPLTGETTTSISLDSSTGRSQRGDPITLVIRCRAGTTDIYIDWHQVVNTESQTVDWGLGYGSLSSASWRVSTDNEATFYPGDDVSQVKEFFGHTRLVVLTTPSGYLPITATFDITGIQNAVAGVRQTCGW